MTGVVPAHYTLEFKQEVVRLLRGGQSRADRVSPEGPVGGHRLDPFGSRWGRAASSCLPGAQTGRAIGATVGMEVYADLLPEHKLKIVEERRAKGEIVAKVSDGISDAPVLAAADVGIAVGGGTDFALEATDAATLHGRVGDVIVVVTPALASWHLLAILYFSRCTTE